MFSTGDDYDSSYPEITESLWEPYREPIWDNAHRLNLEY
ncbi:hypothetical protein DESC_180068 [Desulfosarcina cetonica]|nr:hypothetical protein DESC_180068 [Desulfosarcina cetonica]